MQDSGIIAVSARAKIREIFFETLHVEREVLPQIYYILFQAIVRQPASMKLNISFINVCNSINSKQNMS